MTARRLLTAALLLFVVASVATLVGKEFRNRSVAGNPKAVASPGIPGSRTQVVAYYFVGKVRCSSCRRIEELSRKTIEASFQQELADGRLRFLVVNVDQPASRHYAEEYRLEGSSLVLAEMRDGKPAGWKNLPDVWTLVDDPAKLETYVRSEVAAMMRGI